MQTPQMNPALMQGVPMDGFARGWEMGSQRRRESETRRAMAALMANPNDPQALQSLAQLDPQTAMQFRQQQAQAAMQQVEQHRDQIKIGAQIIRQVQPKDQASWDQALMVAQQYGINPDQIGVPRQFDPSYVQNIVGLADALDPAGSDLMAVAPGTVVFDKAARAEVFKNPDRPRYYPVPPGGMLVPEPGAGTQAVAPQGAPQPGQVEDGYRFKGGNPADPNSWEPVGGSGGNVGGGFPGY